MIVQDSSEELPIVVLGGGIGGLAAAHHLRSYCDKEIHLYECDEDVGGLARSWCNDEGRFLDNGFKVITNTYGPFIDLLKEIPSATGDATVADHIIPSKNFCVDRGECSWVAELEHPAFNTPRARGWLNWLKHMRLFLKETGCVFKWRDIATLWWWSLKFQNNPRAMEDLDDVTWHDFAKELHPTVRNIFVDGLGFFCGQEPDKFSAHSVLSMLFRDSKADEWTNVSLSRFDGAPSDVWFRPWRKYLESRNVIIHCQRTAERMIEDGGSICAVEVRDNSTGRVSTIRASRVVCALPPHAMPSVYPAKGPSLKRFQDLDSRVSFNQVGVMFYPKEFVRGPEIVMLTTTPWYVGARLEGKAYGLDYEVINAVASVNYVKGSNGKCTEECTREEFAIEVWEQIRKTNVYDLPAKMPQWTIVETLQSVRGQWVNSRPKVGNNAGSLHLRPSTRDDYYTNLYYAAAWTKTHVNVESMLSAAVAGKNAAISVVEDMARVQG